MKTTNESDTMEVLLNIYLFCKKFMILLLVFLVLGVACGIYKYKSFKPVFGKQVLIYSEDVSYILLKQFTVSLSNDIDAGNYSAVAQKMYMDENTARKIADAKTDSVALRGKVYALTMFTLRDTAGTADFSKHYIKYLSGVEYLRTIMDNNKLRYTKILEKIDQKLKELDGMQLKSGGSSTVMMNDSYREYVDLYSKKMDYEERLKSKSGIDIIRESTAASSPRFGMVMSCMIYGMIFLVFGAVIGFFIELFGKLRKLEKSRK